MFFLSGNASICRPMSDASILRDTNWATQTCIIGCNTIGVWPESYDGTDVRVCAKSKTNNLLVAGASALHDELKLVICELIGSYLSLYASLFTP